LPYAAFVPVPETRSSWGFDRKDLAATKNTETSKREIKNGFVLFALYVANGFRVKKSG